MENSVAFTPRVKGVRYVSADEAIEIMKKESGYVILDVRRPDEFEECRIPGAVNVPNESIGIKPIAELPDKNQLILIYCRRGRRSKIAASKLLLLGYTNLVEFGGINEWCGETVSGY